MPTYEVSREVLALVTVHGETDATAPGAAQNRLEVDLATALPEESAFELLEASVVATPGAPREPHRVEVPFAVAVGVEAPDPGAARDRGADRIDGALGRVDADWEYATDPTVERRAA